MNINKPQKDRFKDLVLKQGSKKPPPQLGETTINMDIVSHIKEKHKLLSFTKIKDINGKKQALVTTPNKGQTLLPVKEDMFGYYFIWIICINEETGQILFRVNAADMDFINWDIPKETEK